jgi:hypothetical protein
MTNLDVHVILDTLVTLTVVEVLVKPVIVYCGQWILRKTDTKVKWIPDWLYTKSPENH